MVATSVLRVAPTTTRSGRLLATMRATALAVHRATNGLATPTRSGPTATTNGLLGCLLASAIRSHRFAPRCERDDGPAVGCKNARHSARNSLAARTHDRSDTCANPRGSLRVGLLVARRRGCPKLGRRLGTGKRVERDVLHAALRLVHVRAKLRSANARCNRTVTTGRRLLATLAPAVRLGNHRSRSPLVTMIALALATVRRSPTRRFHAASLRGRSLVTMPTLTRASRLFASCHARLVLLGARASRLLRREASLGALALSLHHCLLDVGSPRSASACALRNVHERVALHYVRLVITHRNDRHPRNARAASIAKGPTEHRSGLSGATFVVRRVPIRANPRPRRRGSLLRHELLPVQTNEVRAVECLLAAFHLAVAPKRRKLARRKLPFALEMLQLIARACHRVAVVLLRLEADGLPTLRWRLRFALFLATVDRRNGRHAKAVRSQPPVGERLLSCDRSG